jgi:hypothetical protein
MKSISIIRTKHILLCLLIVISNLKTIRLHSQNEAAMAIGGAVAVAELITFCQTKLKSTESEVNKIIAQMENANK